MARTDSARACIMKPSMRDRPDLPRARALADSGRSDRFWPLVALIAAILATAGWTTVIVMSLNDRDPVAAASPSVEPSVDESIPETTPEPLSHESPELEGLLPAVWEGTALQKESWTGDVVLLDDEWSQTFRTFLDDQGKTPADLLVAQAADPTGVLQMSVGAFRIDGATGAQMLETVVAAWKAEYPDLETTTIELGGKNVTRGVFSDGDINSYWYEHEGVVFDVETADEALATAVLETLP